MKGVLAVIGLVVLCCALTDFSSMRRNISSWVGSCWNCDAPCADRAYHQPPVRQYYNYNSSYVNRTYVGPVYRRPLAWNPFYR